MMKKFIDVWNETDGTWNEMDKKKYYYGEGQNRVEK
jgi:hypothetical protein